MEWVRHNEWAEELFGIPEDVSNDVNKVVDYDEDNPLPQPPPEYTEALSVCKDIKKSKGSKSAFSMVAAHYAKNNHDSSSSSKTAASVAAEYELCAMRRMSDEDEYVKAWRLHYYLDYLDENATQDKTLTQLLDEYRSYHSHHLCSEEIRSRILEYGDKLSKEVGTSLK